MNKAAAIHDDPAPPAGPATKARRDQDGTVGRAEVLHGDAYDLAPALPPKSVDLIITSPPYWGHRSYGGEHNWKILDDWKRAGGSVEETPPYDWYREHGGKLGLEPIPEWYIGHLVELLDRLKPAR